jgi:septal ring factor EnvC (AmiA/AmiB activator)
MGARLGRLARLAFCALALVSPVGTPAHAADRAATAEELDAVEERIRGLERSIGRAAAAKPTAGKALEEAEGIEADARRSLDGVRRRLAEGRARERTLRAEIASAEKELTGHRRALEAQLRLAYASGREQWLRLVLAEQNPVDLSRKLTYHRYLVRERGALLEEVQGSLATLTTATAELEAELGMLAALKLRQEARVQEVAAARRVRARALQTIERDLGTRREKLARLRREARGLEQLMARLERQSRPAPQLPDTAPPQQVKDLPLRGRMVARYGQPRADGLLRWEGMVLAAPAGTDVRAARAGRVVYADWLPGLGQLVVLDHGQGLMSLYGHNQDLLKKTGEPVRQGEAIARVGDSGGQGSPGLYFEVRRNGKPIDPRGWVR